MRACIAIGSLKLAFVHSVFFPDSRTQFSAPGKPLFCKVKYDVTEADNEIDEFFSPRVVPENLLAAEKEEAKAVVTLFLKKQGLSKAVAVRTITNSDLFIDHLVSRLHSIHKSRYLVGKEVTTLEIRDALIPYLESLLEEHGNALLDLIESFLNHVDDFPNPPVKEKPDAPVSARQVTLDSMTEKALARLSKADSAGQLPPSVLYLIDLGMDLEQIKKITRKFPAFAYYSLEGKIKPLVEFLLELGVSKLDVPTILAKRPQLCGISLTENLIPTMRFLEGLGVDKERWAKVIHRFPAVLTVSRLKAEATVNFLIEMGVPAERIGMIIARFPVITSYRIEDKLRPTAEYFRSLGVDAALILQRRPQVFGLSLEANLKPVVEFFLAKGFSVEEVGIMSKCGSLFAYSLEANVIPKWEFFLTMDYSKEELVKFPLYFCCSLEDRIKPRYAIVKESGVRLSLSEICSFSDPNFTKALERRMRKKLSGKASK